MKKFFSVILILSNFMLLTAQNISVITSDAVPLQDGSVSNSEYSTEAKISKATLYFSLSKDGSILYAAFRAESKGWLALGLNAGKMDGALMTIGFEDLKNISVGAKIITVQGTWHFHSEKKSDIIIKKAVKETDGITTLEIAIDVKKAKILVPSTIKFIYAIGIKDDLVSQHALRGSGSLTLK